MSESRSTRFFKGFLGPLLLAAAGLLLPFLILRDAAAPPAAAPDLPRERLAVAIYNHADCESPRDGLAYGALESHFRKRGYAFRALHARDLDPARDGRAAVYVLALADKPLAPAAPLRDLLVRASSDGAKVIMLGNPTAFFDSLGGFNRYNRLLNLCGAEDRGGFVSLTGEAAVERHPAFFPEVTSAEVRAQFTFLRRLAPLSDRVTPLAEARSGDIRFTPALVGPGGGLAMNPLLFLRRGDAWRPCLDLPAFLDAALTGEVPPRLNGAAPRPLARRALVLFSTKEAGYRINLFRRFAQLPLNYLGYDFEYLDTAGLAEVRPPGRHDLVVTAFQSPNHENYEAVLRFLIESEAGKFIFLQNLPVYDARGECPNWPLVVSFFQKFHVRFDGYSKYDGTVSLEATKDGALYPFESSFSATAETMFGRLIPLHDHHPIVSFRTPRALYTPGYHDGRALFLIGDLLFDWRSDLLYVNLFEAFRRFLTPPVVPLWQFGHGPRLFFAHIDGDGLFNSHEDSPHILGGERVLSLLEANPLPCSASFIVQEILADRLGRPASLALARRIAALPNVEAASHTLNHPLHWGTRATTEVLDAQDHDEVREDAYTVTMVQDAKAEIEDSVDAIGRLFPGAPRLLFWSGDCMPTEGQLKRARLAGILALNGGDTRKDRERPGYTFVAPPYGRIGAEAQVHTGAANEMPFTNLWDGPYDGFAKVIETLENTGRGYVVSPANIYCHFYSGEREDAFAALRRVYDWAAAQELSPLFASEYVALVHDWIGCRIAAGSDEVRIATEGHLRAAWIFKESVSGEIDLARCEGILGYEEGPDRFMVHLDGGRTHVVRFAPAPVAPTPHIRRATHRAQSLPAAEGDRLYRFRGHGPFRVLLAGLDGAASWRVTRHGDGVVRETFERAGTGCVEVTGILRGTLDLSLERVR